jgi:hypothetical protein
VKDLVDSWDREALDKPGWDLALVSLGMEQEAPPWTPHCDNLWHFDSECIHGDGSYVAIARRIAGMTGGSLKLSNLKDHVDLAKKEAWLRFTCAGKPITIKPRVEDDWVDPNIFDRFCELLSEQAPSKMFIYYDLKGQDCIIGCLPRSQFAALQREVPGFRNLDGTGPTRVGSRPTPLPGG